MNRAKLLYWPLVRASKAVRCSSLSLRPGAEHAPDGPPATGPRPCRGALAGERPVGASVHRVPLSHPEDMVAPAQRRRQGGEAPGLRQPTLRRHLAEPRRHRPAGNSTKSSTAPEATWKTWLLYVGPSSRHPYRISAEMLRAIRSAASWIGVAREMGVSRCRLDVAVAEQLADHRKRFAELLLSAQIGR